jgi:hypothetical protein
VLGVIGQFAPLLFDLSPSTIVSDAQNYPKSVRKTVRAYLIGTGLDPNFITTTGYGMSQPLPIVEIRCRSRETRNFRAKE